MDKVYLAPCPFCAGAGKKESYDPYDGYQGRNTVYRVRCSKCGAMVKADSFDEAVKKWNMRAAKLMMGSMYGSLTNKPPVLVLDQAYTSECPIPDMIVQCVQRMLEHPEERSE